MVAIGNDYSNPGIEEGLPLRDMELMIDAGMSPSDIIIAATRNGAEVCG